MVLGLLVNHEVWGTIALPLLARLYIRKKDLPGIDPKHRPPFRTKLELAVELLRWAKSWLGLLGKPLWVVADGAYAKADFLKPAKALVMTVVSRLRKDAALWSVPGPKPPSRRGPAPTYGDRRIDLAKRAGQRRGWSTGVFDLYGEKTSKRYKTFLATWRPAGGLIWVVLVDEPTEWRAYFCTDASASVADILSAVADRFSLEQGLYNTMYSFSQDDISAVSEIWKGTHPDGAPDLVVTNDPIPNTAPIPDFYAEPQLAAPSAFDPEQVKVAAERIFGKVKEKKRGSK